MARAGVSANSRKDFDVVAIDQMKAALGVELDQLLHVFGVDAAVIAAGLPRVDGVVAILIPLNPDGGFRKQIDAAHVVPVCVADDNVANRIGRNARGFDSLVGAEVILHRKFFKKRVAMKSAIKEDRVAA